MDLSPTQVQPMKNLRPPTNMWRYVPKTKVVLITLPSPWLISDRDMPNLGILYVAASLREAGVNVQVVDYCGVPTDFWFLPEGDVYGISCTTPQWPLAKFVADKIRRQNPGAYIVAGGYHPSAMPDHVLESEVDCVLIGDGELTMLDIVNGNRPTKGKLVGTRVDPIDTVPWPARDMVAIRDYQRIGTNAVAGLGVDGRELREEYVLQSRG